MFGRILASPTVPTDPRPAALPPAARGSSVVEPDQAARLLKDLGFLASPDLPDRPGPAYLLVAIRATPTLRHYDPESVDYWVTDADRGVRRTLTRETRLPVSTDFSWGLIRITDRLHETNEYLTFGGTLRAARVDDAVVAAFTSPVPLLRRGGHSQAIDPAAVDLGAFFGRFLLAVDYVPGFERAAASAEPIARYAAFLVDVAERYRRPPFRDAQPELASLLGREIHRIKSESPGAWTAGAELRAAAAAATARRTMDRTGGFE